MVNLDEGQIRALNILLSNIKYSDIDVNEIFRFVPKSKINEIHGALRQFDIGLLPSG